MNPERSERIEIPVLPLRDVVVYPHMVIPLFVGREKSIRCLEAAMDHDKKIMLVAQKEASTDEPGVNDLFTVGTVASILQMLKLPDGTVKALVSCLTGNPVRADVAMTGEITLRGQVLPIGGLKEKLLAAHRGGIKTVLIPDENKRDLEEIPDNVIADLDIHPVKRIEEVLTLALQNEPFGMQVVTAK
ncbi:LON peptidase substrate-binding domain-containing protein [Klebsiella pneumoniae]|uniref:S16 family serine protease n=1 Tax=Klebsiella pneumoniae TaxID=573 RepID=UPI001BCA849B|nr:S16 family serine protease [Klebsiella pneumoniae]MBS4580201.1 LON peptidase substrate-binding domain-containing protein [Klebsiella pneumoniae]